MTTLDCKLHPKLWQRVQQEFVGPKGHTCDLMALDSNVMTDQDGSLLPHFTPHRSPQSCGVNFFAQDLSSGAPFLSIPKFFRLSLSDGSCSAFSEILRAVVHGHSIRCLSEKVLVSSYPKLCQ